MSLENLITQYEDKGVSFFVMMTLNDYIVATYRSNPENVGFDRMQLFEYNCLRNPDAAANCRVYITEGTKEECLIARDHIAAWLATQNIGGVYLTAGK